MDTYTLLREFADSWFLIVLCAFFVGTWFFAFWPSQQSARDEAANIPLRDETTRCAGTCETCKSKFDFLKGAGHE
jgi:cytochrome c oxidase cbb3-type subunit 4